MEEWEQGPWQTHPHGGGAAPGGTFYREKWGWRKRSGRWETHIGLFVLLTLILASYTGVYGWLTNDGFGEERVPPVPLRAPPASGGVNGTLTSTPISYHYRTRFVVSDVYEKYGGTILVRVENLDSTYLFVKSIHFAGEWGVNVVQPVYKLVGPGDEKKLGVVAFPPPTSGIGQYHRYQIGLEIFSGHKKGRTMEWYPVGVQYQNVFSFVLHPLARDIPVFISTQKNDLWPKVEKLVDPDNPTVQSIKTEIQSKWGDNYTTAHVAAAFDYVYDHIKYSPEPEGADHWQSVAETLKKGEGDCEDHAILLASIIDALGGTTRMCVISNHAFATVYFGGTEEEAMKNWDAVKTYYGFNDTVAPVHPAFIVADGYWLSVDTLGGFYAGCLPVNAAPTGSTAWEWDFTSTTALYMVPS